MDWAIYALYAIVIGLAIYGASQGAPKTKPPALDPGAQPTAEEGTVYKRLYGTKWDPAPIMVWYGDPLIETETEDHVKTFKYSLGMHVINMQGVPDAFIAAKADGRIYWEGEVTENDEIFVDAGDLFGGKRQRGGIVGYIDVLFGREDQGVNAYLAGVLPGPLPGLRGAAGLVFKQVYLTANNPYIPPHAFRWRRILEGWRDDICWYPETAEIPCNCDADPSWRNILICHFDDETFHDSSQDARVVDPQGNLGNPGPFLDDEDPLFGGYAWSNGSGGINHAPVLLVSPGENGEGHALEGQFTMDAGAWFNEVDREQCVFGYVRSATIDYASLDVRINDSGYPIVVETINSTSNVLITADAPVSAGEWVRLRVARDADNTLYLFVGGFVQSQTVANYTSVVNGSYICILGQLNVATFTNVLNGKVDEVVITRGLCRSTGDYTPDAEPFVDDSFVGACTTADMNPAHCAYDLITDQNGGMGRPIADIDDASFRAAASTLRSECFGVSFWNAQQGAAADQLKALEEVADMVVDIDPIDGTWYCDLIRGDYDPDELLVLDESNILAIENLKSHAYGNVVSRVILKYSDPDTDEPAETRWDNPATYGAQNNRLTIATVEMPQIRQHSLASKVCAREGLKRTHPLKAFTIRANREAYGLRRGRAIKVSHAKYGLSNIVCRVIAYNSGNLRNREIKLAVVEDIFGMPISSYVGQQTSQWTDIDWDADPITVQTAMELPRWHLKQALGEGNVSALDDAAGYAQPMGVRPSGLSIGFDIWRQKNAAGYTEERDDRDFARTALLSASITGEDTAATIESSTLSIASTGDLLQLGEGAEAELVRLTGGNLSSGIEWTRGHLDTTPKEWPAGTRLWRLPEPGELEDDNEYTDGDVIDYKLLARTPQDSIALADASAVSITLDSRQVRPIAPGNVTINGEAWPALLEGALTVEWEHRDRLAHTDTTLQTATGITTEAGVTYNVYAYDDADDTLLDSDTGLSGTTWSPSIGTSCTLRIEIEAERDGYVSWQRQVRTFDYIATEALAWSDGDFVLWSDGEILE